MTRKENAKAYREAEWAHLAEVAVKYATPKEKKTNPIQDYLKMLSTLQIKAHSLVHETQQPQVLPHHIPSPSLDDPPLPLWHCGLASQCCRSDPIALKSRWHPLQT
mmetsp:Transcript_1519/g.4085  ORF Transcript_1519/g.4085 Transcript_1519/m.4085 type:complete len:106 (-) Transcript_1519:572-889(-)